MSIFHAVSQHKFHCISAYENISISISRHGLSKIISLM
uniref:Uncharacterized protein n=1 Tax=Rhizophora mucronata TaxID=61149 RepID=A0A2P2NAP9_RHIMU